MSFPGRNHHRHNRKRPYEPLPDPAHNLQDLVRPEHTGAEAEYMQSLIDSHTVVTVVLTDGEKYRGNIRYYDTDCFSIGLSARGPRLFIRKSSVAYIAEE